MIAEKTIEEIKARANLVEIVGESQQLRRQGSSYVCCCPFHQERSPSFHIRDGGRFYHCFGCGVSGNAISYVMQMRGLSFPEAVEELAERYGITVALIGGRPERDRVNTGEFYQANQLAQEFFQRSLQEAPAAVKKYVAERGFTPEAMRAFGLGFSPLKWQGLCDFLRGKKISEELLLRSGLARRNSRGELYDGLRGRLVFPIFQDPRRIAGFGGRVIPGLNDNPDAPKYVNSSDSPVYNKSKLLFGLPQALQAIRQKGDVFVVEGYMDVIGLWQVGIQNVVATCGTALTEQHVRRIAQLCKRVTVLFDGDAAGRAAAAKSFAVFLNSGIDASARFLPDEDDPDTLARRLGVATGDYLAALPAQPLLDSFIDQTLAAHGAADAGALGAAAKGTIGKEVAAIVSRVENPIERDELLKRVSYRLRVDSEHLVTLAGASRAAVEPLTSGVPSGPVRQPGAGGGRSSEGEANAAHSNSRARPAGQQEPPDIAFSGRPVTDLPRLDRELLLVVMAMREQYVDSVLNDPLICEAIHPTTRAFVEGLSAILASDLTREEQRQATKALLLQFGESWVAHWKTAHEMLEDQRVKFVQVFEQCRQALDRAKFQDLGRQLTEQLAAAQDDAEREDLSLKLVALKRSQQGQ